MPGVDQHTVRSGSRDQRAFRKNSVFTVIFATKIKIKYK